MNCDDDLSRTCQLKKLASAGSPLPLLQKTIRCARRAQRLPRYLAGRVRRAFTAGVGLWRTLGLRSSLTLRPAPLASPGNSADSSPHHQRLGLAPGDAVRVKSLDQIRATLDANGRYDRMAFMDSVMARFCGGTFLVRKRVTLFFDERRWRLLRLRGTVILDGVFCESTTASRPAQCGGTILY